GKRRCPALEGDRVMASYEEKVAGMLAQGQITADEAAQLLVAARPRAGSARFSWLWNPLARLGTSVGILTGLADIGVGLALARFGVRFDGALDMHVTGRPVPWLVAISDALVSLPGCTLVLFLVAKVSGSRGRFRDFLLGTAYSRVPAVLTAPLALATFDAEAVQAATAGRPPLKLVIGALSLVPFLVWQITLLFSGYREASGLRGPRVGFSFVGALLLAEVASKLLLWALH
ncbi:MAG TPA: YIP1 family protein, partial [Polyangiaceae bacterium]|nr:YIP1 family protein [Polyangiaceae bacterium]